MSCYMSWVETPGCMRRYLDPNCAGEPDYETWIALLGDDYGWDLCFSAPQMLQLLDEMETRCMLTQARKPALPTPEAFGVPAADAFLIEANGRGLCPNGVRSPSQAYAEAMWDALSTSTGRDGIPHFKLEPGTRPWRVTPEEIEGALCKAARYSGFDQPSESALVLPDAWGVSPRQEWLRFLGGGRDHGGFAVRWRRDR
jgi:hypothetical protein